MIVERQDEQERRRRENRTMRTAGWRWACLSGICVTLWLAQAPAADQPQWGVRYTRNMVSQETGLPDRFEAGERDRDGNIDPATTENVKWVARLGNTTYSTPIVAGGKVFIGTNNETPRDPRVEGDRGVLMCFDEETGRFLWQLVVPKALVPKWSDWKGIGITSAPTIEGNRAYLVSNACEVICLDTEGMADGNDGPFTDEGRHMAPEGEPPLEPGPNDADVVWLYDMNAELNVEPHNASNCSVLVDGDHLYVCTSNGTEWTHMFVVHPEAPSVIVLDKQTGKLLARDDFGIGPDIAHGQWSSLSLGKVGARRLAFFGAGNGFLYAFETIAPNQGGDGVCLLKNVWRFHGHPLAQTQDHVPTDHQHDSTSYQVTGMPVLYKNRIYVNFTQEPFHNMKEGWLLCLDATKTGNITRSGILWAYDEIGSSPSTVSIADGLVYVAEYFGRLHCLDAETGKPYWVHEVGSPVSGSTLVADGKVYLGTNRNEFWVLAAGKEKKVISQIRMRDKIHATPTAANGVLYVATNRHLYAVCNE
jgi:outer membrane protein assembly factor BamB